MRAMAAATALLLFGACAAVTQPNMSPAATMEPGARRTTEVSAMPSGAHLPAAIMDPILDDAAARAGVPREELSVRRAEAVTWPDAGLGCPQPGVAYPQVLVDGYWVIVEADGTTFDYRGRGRGQFILCDIPARDRHKPVGGSDS